MKGMCKKMYAGQVIDILLQRCYIVRISSIDSYIVSLKITLLQRCSSLMTHCGSNIFNSIQKCFLDSSTHQPSK